MLQISQTADMFGEDRPDQVASRDDFARCFPEGVVIWPPIGDPRRITPAH
jgi:hypothetical protein